MFRGIAGRHPVVLSNTPPLPPPLFPREKKKDSPDLSSPLKGKLAHRWELWELVYQAPLPSHSRAPTLILVSLLSLSWRRKSQPTPVFLPGKSHGQRSLAGYSQGLVKSWTQLSNWANTSTHSDHKHHWTVYSLRQSSSPGIIEKKTPFLVLQSSSLDFWTSSCPGQPTFYWTQ